MKRIVITLLIPTLWLLVIACSSNKELKKNSELAQTENLSAPDSTKKKADEQYLVVKFRQNDTEVEMALDPLATNLNVELVRGKDGLLSVTKGDSAIYKNNVQPSDEELTHPQNTRKGELLTDEIIRDINLAQKLFYERRYAEALNVLQSSLQRKKTATAYALGGSIYFVNGEIASAVQAWESALKINPNLEDVRQLIMRYKESE